MNIILPILSFLCGVMLTETASGSSEEGKPSPGVVQELWFGIPGASVKDLTHRKIFETAAPDVRTISHLDVENLGDRYGARYSALLKVPASGKYRLYLSSDDSAELWLGKDASQKDMACIATAGSLPVLFSSGDSQGGWRPGSHVRRLVRAGHPRPCHHPCHGAVHTARNLAGRKKTIPSQSGLKDFLITFPPGLPYFQGTSSICRRENKYFP